MLSLNGPLAAGKTTLTQQILKAMGYHQPVGSPTFVIEKRYPVDFHTIKQVIHLDLYRLDEAHLKHFDWSEYLEQPDTLTIIEWPERAKSYLPPRQKIITITIDGEKTRTINLPDDLAR